MAIRDVRVVERDDSLFSITFYVNHDFHQLFMTREVFEKVVGYDSDNTLRLAEYIYTLFN